MNFNLKIWINSAVQESPELLELLIFRNFEKKNSSNRSKTVPTVPERKTVPSRYWNGKTVPSQYQVGTGTEKPYRVSTKLVLELKNRTKTVPTVPVRVFGTGTNLHDSKCLELTISAQFAYFNLKQKYAINTL